MLVRELFPRPPEFGSRRHSSGRHSLVSHCPLAVPSALWLSARMPSARPLVCPCLLYTSDAADDM
eukprot:15306599-Alexandrium_andersonii.AAC.1